MLRDLGHPRHDRLLAGWDRGEDAALWDLENGQVAILTVDLITPVVNDPYQWGQIAAANSLSDAFAMGGFPRVALNVVGFPVHCEPLTVLREVMRGGRDKICEAGALLAGGHSVEDDEPKYGLVVYGEVAKDRIWRVSGARPGDLLVLTKPLGTGVLITALKAELLEEQFLEPVVASMAMLNDLPRYLPDPLFPAVRACTDVTGFGFIGHLLDMLGPQLDVTLSLDAIPFFPGAREKAGMGLVPAGAYRNREAYGKYVSGLGNHGEGVEDLLFDPQTSGGLLVAVDPAFFQAFLRETRALGAQCIGVFQEGCGRVSLG